MCVCACACVTGQYVGRFGNVGNYLTGALNDPNVIYPVQPERTPARPHARTHARTRMHAHTHMPARTHARTHARRPSNDPNAVCPAVPAAAADSESHMLWVCLPGGRRRPPGPDPPPRQLLKLLQHGPGKLFKQ